MMGGRKEKFACVKNCTLYISQAFRTFWLSELEGQGSRGTISLRHTAVFWGEGLGSRRGRFHLSEPAEADSLPREGRVQPLP